MLFAVSDFKQVAPKKTKFGVGTLSLDLSPSSSTTTSTSTTSSSKLTFTSSKDGSTFIINLNDIIKRQASSETDKKPLLRLTVEGGIIVQVTFGSRGDLEAVREQIKIGLEGTSRGNSPVPMQVDGKSSSKSKKRSAPTSPPSPVTTFNSSTSQKTKKRKIATSSSTSALTKVHQHRIKILADSIEIKTTYDELVKGGIMDEEEFWNTHEKDVIIAMSRLSGRGTTKTIADAQLPDFHSSEISFAGEDNVLRLRLLFEVYPNIKRMFEESVGIWRKDFTDEEKEKYRRDEERFLGEFATSSYCRRDSAKGIKSKVKVDDKFSRFEDEVEREEMRRRRRERKELGKGEGKIRWGGIGERVDRFDLTSSLNTERPLGLRSGHNLFSDRDSSAPTASRAPSGVDRLIKKHNKVGHVKANYNNIVEEARLESSVEEAERLAKLERLNGQVDPDTYEKMELKCNANEHLIASAGAKRTKSIEAEAALRRQVNDNMEAHQELMAVHNMKSFGIYPNSDTYPLFPGKKMGSIILNKLSISMSESANSSKRSTNIQDSLDKAFTKKLKQQFNLTTGLLRHFFEMQRQNRSQTEDKTFKKIIEKIEGDYEVYKREVKGYMELADEALKEANGLREMGRKEKKELSGRISELERKKDLNTVKMKMLVPLRDQLEVVYGLTGRAKGGWT
ncbi:hypothetical protein TL16_g03494 [Triparma laevis f. inornata]|uniref:BSD domain-containing protein n=1 Tax=Triparma laevis f. inornata TaxID=1714386 RepID=A0A9W7A5Y7_9STRA|nr:hypothetical protein TL16_g03494 [Triparma laevis f. inornata]